MGPLVKLASLVSPKLGKIYTDSVEFGQQLPRHNDNGPGDAARHAYASARVANEFSPATAKALGALYEMTSLMQDRRSQAMDEYNNARGRELTGLPDDQLKEVILGMLSEGGLKTLKSGQADQGYAKGGLVQDAKGVYGDPRADYETAKAAVSGFTGLGERPSVMTGDAETYDKSELAGLLSNLMPGKAAIGGLAAMAAPISRAKMLAALYGKSHPSYKEILNAKVPEEIIAALSPELARAKNPVMDKLARRWEVVGRDLYDPGVVHYDVSGGSSIPDIIRAQKGFAQELLDVPSNMKEYLASLYSKGQMRTMDLGKLDKGNTVYVPHDPWYGSRPPNLEGRNMFYVNEIEGNPGIARAPSRVDIESILNEPELRRELNLSLAVPEESLAHKGSKVYKKHGGLVQYHECNCKG